MPKLGVESNSDRINILKETSTNLKIEDDEKLRKVNRDHKAISNQSKWDPTKRWRTWTAQARLPRHHQVAQPALPRLTHV